MKIILRQKFPDLCTPYELYQLLAGLFKPYSALWLHCTACALRTTQKKWERGFYGIIVEHSGPEVQVWFTYPA